MPATPPFVVELEMASDEALRAMVRELLAANKMVRGTAPVKHVFESAVEDLARWALHDGWMAESGTLVRITPAAEESTGVRDKLLEDLTASDLDGDNAIRTAIEDSAKHFVAIPPDLNASTTKVRIALETIARRAAPKLAAKNGEIYEGDSWGKALQLMRTLGAIEKDEDEILARVYTFISPGSHVPKGLTAEEWARLARTFGLSSAYFLLQKYVSAA
jgi:hypothetical protein